MLRNWALALRPSLSLDFLAGLNDSRITYSGGANGTRVNSSGVIVAATTPRFDYDPVTLAAKGLLVEEARTNLLSYSKEFDNAAWSKDNVTVTADATTSPDGTANADAIFEAATTSTHSLFTSGSTVVAGSSESFSLYVKPNGRTVCMIQVVNGAFSNGFRAEFTLTGAGTVSATLAFGAGTFTAASITQAANGFYRCTVSGIVDGVATSVRTQCLIETAVGTDSYLGDITKGLYLWGAQLEAGSFPTSYIPTTSAAVTRTADSAVMTGTNFSSWYNATQGSFISVFDTVDADAVPGNVWEVGDGTFNERMNAFVSSTPTINFVVTDGGIQVANFSTGAYTTGNVAKSGIAYAANDFAGCLNGGTVGTDTSGALPTVDAFYIGRQGAGGASLNGHIQSIAFYPRRLSNERLQALTS